MPDRKISETLRAVSQQMRPMCMAISEVLAREAKATDPLMVTLIVWGTENDQGWVQYASNAERASVIASLEELLGNLKRDQSADAPPVPLHERQ
jgi:hypothetical protein